jgi:colanic acid/amylovoran biosynthesis glycosyltransferase
MWHVHRHVHALKSFRPVVITQKLRGTWPGEVPHLIKRSAQREIGRLRERWTGAPWELSGGETRQITNLLHQETCSLLHLFFGSVAIHMLPLMRSSPVPVVVSFHGSDVAGAMAGTGYRAALGEMFERAALVPCRSQHLADQVRALGCPQAKLRVMRAVLPPITRRHLAKPMDGGWSVLQAGRLVPKKGMITALKAFARFHRHFPKATFTIAGEGPLKETLGELAARLGLTEAVDFCGFLSQDELTAKFKKAHLYLHPSETVDGDTEGVPNALLEAMAHGIPSVSTRHGGIPEAVDDGISGLLCGEREPDQLAESLLRLANDPVLYAKISEGAARQIAEKFSPEARSEQIESLYREAVTKQNPDRPTGG